jgi:hypothetical protein
VELQELTAIQWADSRQIGDITYEFQQSLFDKVVRSIDSTLSVPTLIAILLIVPPWKPWIEP